MKRATSCVCCVYLSLGVIGNGDTSHIVF
jgi:hypothetical protein